MQVRSNIQIKIDGFFRPQTPVTLKRQFGNHPDHLNIQDDHQMNNKVVVPLKEYSNKFLRNKEEKYDNNYSLFKPSNSMIYNRKQLRRRKSNPQKKLCNKENEGKGIKNQTYQIRDEKCSNESKQIPFQRSYSSTNSKEYSSSRALEFFSKVFKNKNIERWKIRKQIINRKLDVEIKQVRLQDKEDRKQKEKYKTMVTLNKKFFLHPHLFKVNQEKDLSADQDSFQIAGW